MQVAFAVEQSRAAVEKIAWAVLRIESITSLIQSLKTLDLGV